MGQTIPLNQQNSLPLLDIQQNTTGGSTQIVGGTVTRVFTDADLGITATLPTQRAVQGGNVWGHLETPYLDLRGMSQFSLALRCHNTTQNPSVTYPVIPFMQHRNGPTDAPDIFIEPATVNDGQGFGAVNACGMLCVGATSAKYPAIVVGATITVLYTWWRGLATTDANTNVDAVFGQNYRLVLDFGATPARYAGQFFTAWLEASS